MIIRDTDCYAKGFPGFIQVVSMNITIAFASSGALPGGTNGGAYIAVVAALSSVVCVSL